MDGYQTPTFLLCCPDLEKLEWQQQFTQACLRYTTISGNALWDSSKATEAAKDTAENKY